MREKDTGLSGIPSQPLHFLREDDCVRSMAWDVYVGFACLVARWKVLGKTFRCQCLKLGPDSIIVAYVCIILYLYIYILMHLYMQLYAYIYIYIYMCVCFFPNLYIYIYINQFSAAICFSSSRAHLVVFSPVASSLQSFLLGSRHFPKKDTPAMPKMGKCTRPEKKWLNIIQWNPTI